MKIIKKDIDMLSEAYSSVYGSSMGRDEDAENSVDYRDLFRSLQVGIQKYIEEIYDGDESGEVGMYDKYGDEGRAAIDKIVGGLEDILGSY
jgi:hypothetical protein